MKLSKEQKDVLATKLQNPWDSVRLLCDGYIVDLQVSRVRDLRFRIMTYVNGSFKGVWVCGKVPLPEYKFLRKVTRNLYSSTQTAKHIKAFGVRNAKKLFPQKTFVTYLPDWPSGKTALNHLCRVCDSVQLAEDAEASA
ncbi:hypothetical protein [Propionivibrio sp.]|uniref:hypothetical protein n=1 Tax=Propionivibrio sp. TaxID=2212460 RepID=UPI003BF408C9